MLHSRKDYMRIQDPKENEGGIPADEPVFLLRAKDKLAPQVVRHWADQVRAAGGDDEMVQAAYRQARRMQEWQDQHGAQVPDMPKGISI